MTQPTGAPVRLGRQADSRTVVNVTLGYLFLGAAGVADSLGDVWYPSNYGHGMVLLEALGFLLIGLGFLSYWNRQAWDSAVFIIGGVSAWTYQASVKLAIQGASGLTLSLPPGEPLSYQGWYFFFLTVFYAALVAPSFRTAGLRKFFIITKAVQFLSAAIACWFGIAILQPICGYLGVLSGVLATFIGATCMLQHSNTHDPNDLQPDG